MISVDEARERILRSIGSLEEEEVRLLEALGRTLAEDIFSPLDIPPRDNAAMDGYAIRASDTWGLLPVLLKVVEEIPAGKIPQREILPGTAARIMTGGIIPPGADAVVELESTDEERRLGGKIEEIAVLRRVSPGENIRPAGEDIRRGELVISRGTVLSPSEIGVLASMGFEKVRVFRRPRIAILSTGDEIAEVGKPLPPGKIYDSNSRTLGALVLQVGGEPILLGIAPDDPEILEKRIKEGIRISDMFIASGGVSVGERDITKGIFGKLGRVDFWKVRMKPGKPLLFGMLRGDEKEIPFFGLPGNPVSVMITFYQFVRPAIRKLQGASEERIYIRAVSKDRIKNKDGRRVFARVKLRREGERISAYLTGPQGSGILTSMMRADGLLIVPEDVEEVKEGDEVLVQLLDPQKAMILTGGESCAG